MSNPKPNGGDGDARSRDYELAVSYMHYYQRGFFSLTGAGFVNLALTESGAVSMAPDWLSTTAHVALASAALMYAVAPYLPKLAAFFQLTP